MYCHFRAAPYTCMRGVSQCCRGCTNDTQLLLSALSGVTALRLLATGGDGRAALSTQSCLPCMWQDEEIWCQVASCTCPAREGWLQHPSGWPMP